MTSPAGLSTRIWYFVSSNSPHQPTHTRWQQEVTKYHGAKILGSAERGLVDETTRTMCVSVIHINPFRTAAPFWGTNQSNPK